MMLIWSTIFVTLVGLVSAVVLPTNPAGFYMLTQDQIDSADPYAHYASAVKCDPQTITHWNCGAHCKATPNFMLYANGGDGNKVLFWFVGYDTAMNSIIVAHQGTDTGKFFADLTDLKLFQARLDPSIFPHIPDGIKVHEGSAEERAKTTADILRAVESLLQLYPSTMVTAVGHSLGAALALLDGFRLRLLLAPTTDVRVVAYGLPRVGNQYFASYVDTILPGGVIRITNRQDPVPVIPGMLLGYRHVLGEIHIQETGGGWITCPGEDNPDRRCSVGAVPTVFHEKFSDHSGPYNNIMLECDGKTTVEFSFGMGV